MFSFQYQKGVRKIEEDDFLNEELSEEEEIDQALEDEEIDAGEAGFLRGYFGEED